ncbi:ATP synthase F1 subunit delta [Chloroflexota bacterium]
MAGKTSARRYSQAVFDVALETKELERWQSDLLRIVSIVGDADFMALLKSPRVHFANKARLVSAQLEGVNPLALNLAYMLIVRGSLNIIGDIADEYQRLVDNYRGLEHAEVVAAISLDDEDILKLAENLSAITGKKVIAKVEVNPDLLGGFMARINGKLLDGSTRSRLMALKKDISGAVM